MTKSETGDNYIKKYCIEYLEILNFRLWSNFSKILVNRKQNILYRTLIIWIAFEYTENRYIIYR